MSTDPDVTAGGAVQPGGDVQQRALAGAGRPHDGREGPGGERGGDVAERVHASGAATVGLRDVDDLRDGFCSVVGSGLVSLCGHESAFRRCGAALLGPASARPTTIGVRGLWRASVRGPDPSSSLRPSALRPSRRIGRATDVGDGVREYARAMKRRRGPGSSTWHSHVVALVCSPPCWRGVARAAHADPLDGSVQQAARLRRRARRHRAVRGAPPGAPSRVRGPRGLLRHRPAARRRGDGRGRRLRGVHRPGPGAALGGCRGRRRRLRPDRAGLPDACRARRRARSSSTRSRSRW